MKGLLGKQASPDGMGSVLISISEPEPLLPMAKSLGHCVWPAVLGESR